MRIRAGGFSLLLLVLASANTARGAARDDIEAARAHYARGTRLYEVGEYRQALAEYKAAHVSKPDPAFLYNIGQCHRQLGDLEQAVVLYKRYLTASPGAANRADVEKRIAELETELAARRRKGQSEPPPQPAPVERPAADIFEPAPTPSPPPSAAPSPPMPSAPLPVPAAPPAPAPAPAVAAGLTTPPPEAQPAGSSLRYLRWLGVGATVALAAGAVLTGVSAQSEYDDLKKTCGNTDAGCPNGEIDKVKSRALVTNILWAATGVAALGTGLMFYATPSQGAVQVAWRF